MSTRLGPGQFLGATTRDHVVDDLVVAARLGGLRGKR